MGNRIVLAGAGGFGRGVFSWLSQSPRHLEEHQITDIVFIDDGLPELEPPGRLISSIDDYETQPNDLVLCTVAQPNVRRSIVRRLTVRGARFHSFVDDRAILGANVRVGCGTVICPQVVVSANVRIGAHVHINFNCALGHDTTLGAFTTLSPSVNIMGQVCVGEDVFLGGSSAVLPRISIGSAATIGAGAVVVKPIEAGSTAVGVPADTGNNGGNDHYGQYKTGRLLGA